MKSRRCGKLFFLCLPCLFGFLFLSVEFLRLFHVVKVIEKRIPQAKTYFSLERSLSESLELHVHVLEQVFLAHIQAY